VHVSRRLLDDEDGPMLELLKGFHGRRIVVPARRAARASARAQVRAVRRSRLIARRPRPTPAGRRTGSPR
jgi:hypothetical protein